MKLLLTGDWHLRFRNPRWRKDDYFASQFGKVKWILETATKKKCKYILQPGDFFDGIDTPMFVLQEYINLLRKYVDIRILCVRGQHDLRYHSSKIENTPLAVMEAAGVLEVVKEFNLGQNKGFVYGSSWNDEIPDVVRAGNGGPAQVSHVLLCHKMIIDDKKLWPGQTDFTTAKHLLRSTKFDLIVSGDNHKSFMWEYEDKHLVNCGSLMRSNIDQADHEPCIYIYDTKTKDLEKIDIPIAPAKEVFDLKASEKEKERNEQLDMFVQGLEGSEDFGLDFMSNVERARKAGNLSADMLDILDEILVE